MSLATKQDALGRLLLAGESLTVSVRSWSDHDGTEHRKVAAGEPDQLEFQQVLQHLRRIGLARLVSITERGDTTFELTDLGRAVAAGTEPWPEPRSDAVAASSRTTERGGLT